MNNIFVVSSSFIVSVLILLSLISNNLLSFWILIEISAFFLIYIFLNSNDNSNVSFSSFIFYLSNGISSIFIISGGYVNSANLIYFGLSCKFFIFPFSILLLYIFENCSWTLIFITGSLFKGLVLCLSYLLNSELNNIVFISSIMSLFLCSIFILSYNLNLKGLWFVLNLSSSTILFISCILLSNDIILILYLLYIALSALNIYCLNNINYINNNINLGDLSYSGYYLFSMVAFPVSINFIYKSISIIICLSSCSSIFTIIWCLYLIIETGFLLFYFSKLLENFSVNY